MLSDNAEEVQPLDVIIEEPPTETVIEEPPTETDQALYPAHSSIHTQVNANINNTNNQMANKHDNPVTILWSNCHRRSH